MAATWSECFLISVAAIILFVAMYASFSSIATLKNLSDAPKIKGRWCIANQKATDAQLQANIDWCCSNDGGKIDCTMINPGGACFEPDTLRDHASWVMNLYYQKLGRAREHCDFGGTGIEVRNDPSHDVCVYKSS